MKRIAYSFLLIALLSCGSSSRLQGNRIRIQFRDSSSAEYHLLAVRDSQLVVFSRSYDDKELIGFSKVERVYHNADGKSTGEALGTLTGLGAGSLIAFSLFPLSQSSGIDIRRGLLIVPATIAGAIIGCSVSKDDKPFDLQDHIDLLSVKQFAQFPYGESAELQKIK